MCREKRKKYIFSEKRKHIQRKKTKEYIFRKRNKNDEENQLKLMKRWIDYCF